jgi:hypothetical protein
MGSRQTSAGAKKGKPTQLRLRGQSPLRNKTHTTDMRPDSLQRPLSCWFLPYHSRANELLQSPRTRYIAPEKSPARLGAIGKCRRSQTWWG